MDSIISISEAKFSYPGEEETVFSDLNLDLPGGVTSVIGQNGTGKSTLLLLAGGRLFPEKGTVEILGKDTRDIEGEEERNELVSFIYQNMEFETEDSVADLMSFIHQNGFLEDKSSVFPEELIDVFELGPSRDTPLNNLSKGEMQRTILAFSLLYGSKIIMMDEPIFALEEYQKKRTMEFMTSYSREHSVHLFYSVHEIELTEKYSDNVMLFYKDSSIVTGPTSEVLTDTAIEEAYELPRTMLYQKENLYRDSLLRLSTIRPDTEIGDN